MASYAPMHSRHHNHYAPHQPRPSHQRYSNANGYYQRPDQGYIGADRDGYFNIELHQPTRHSHTMVTTAQPPHPPKERACYTKPSNIASMFTAIPGGLAIVASKVPQVAQLIIKAGGEAAIKPVFYSGIGLVTVGVGIQVLKCLGRTDAACCCYCGGPDCSGVDCSGINCCC